MLTHPTHERLIALGLTGMAKAFEEQRQSPHLDALSFEERIGLLVDREAAGERAVGLTRQRLRVRLVQQNPSTRRIHRGHDVQEDFRPTQRGDDPANRSARARA